MKKLLFIALMATLIFTTLSLCGCGAKVPERIVGNWQCEDVASDQMTDTGFYSLTINKDGTFSLTDTESGSIEMSGTMTGDDTGKLGILELDCQGDNFNPPECWGSLGKTSRIRYKTFGDDTLKLGYTGIWLTFHPSK